MIENIVEKIINNFDFGYMLTINIMTYLINKVVDRIKEGKSSTLLKRIVLVISIISLTGIYLMVGYDVTTSEQYGDVTINPKSRLIINNGSNGVSIKNGFECKKRGQLIIQ